MTGIAGNLNAGRSAKRASRGIGRRCLLPAVLVLVALGNGCSQNREHSDWNVEFQCDSERERTRWVQVEIHPGECGAGRAATEQSPGDPLYTARIERDDKVTSPPALAAGPYAFSATAYGQGDKPVAGAVCESVQLPRESSITLTLGDPSCGEGGAPDRGDSGAATGGVNTVDAGTGTDASTDASPGDAGIAPDAGSGASDPSPPGDDPDGQPTERDGGSAQDAGITTPETAGQDAGTEPPADPVCDNCVDRREGWTLAQVGSASGANWTFGDDGNPSSLTCDSCYDFWHSWDQGLFAYQEWTGDVMITARIDSVVGSEFTKAGVMIRSSLEPGSVHAGQWLHASAKQQSQYRNVVGAETSATAESVTVGIPSWVRVIRQQQLVQFFYSWDGITWQPSGQDLVPLVDPVLVGIGYSRHDQGQRGSFSNVQIAPP